MGKITIEVKGKKYVVDDKNLEAVDKEKEVKKEVKKEEDKGKEYNREDIDKATDKVMSKLGLDKIKADIDGIKKIVEKKTEKKVSALIDLEKLMKKSVEEMTAREKIIGFFSALVTNDVPVLKALSEGKLQDCPQ